MKKLILKLVGFITEIKCYKDKSIIMRQINTHTNKVNTVAFSREEGKSLIEFFKKQEVKQE